MRQPQKNIRPHGRNFLALLVAGGAIGLAQLNLDPFSIDGSGGGRAIAATAPPVMMPPPPQMPVRLETSNETGDASSEEVAKTTTAEDVTHPTDDPAVLHGIWAVKMTAALLEKGCESFSEIPDYTVSMFKQERINGAMGESQTIDMKVRHEPFSVYMKWTAGDRGRQLIYVDGQNDGNMLVQPGGIKGRLTGLLNLDPNGSLAMAESRHPITQAGILELARTVLSFQKQDIERGHGFDCQLFDNQEFEGRNCYLYLMVYDSEEYNKVYRKSLVYVDKELSMPICVKNFTWGRDVDPEKIDEETLIEFYAYTDLKIEQQLSAADFDQKNRSYRLRVR